MKRRLDLSRLPLRSRLLLYAGVFCTFAPIGVVSDIMALGAAPLSSLAFGVVLAGGGAVAFFIVGTRDRPIRAIAAAVAVYLAAIVAVRAVMPDVPELAVPLDAAAVDRLSTRLALDGGLVIVLLAGSYVAFVSFVAREGARFLAVDTEIRLARGIHRRLVPDVAGDVAGLSWAGASMPSGDVGGDLVDVVHDARGWVACVADVTGHGVAAGVLMGMFKTAWRAAVAETRDPAEILTRIDRVLLPLSEPNMFVTVAVLSIDAAGGELTFGGAGHPPLLISDGVDGTDVRAVPSQGPALAMLPGASWQATPVPLGRDGVAVLVTDGFTETFDRHGREFGIEGIRAAIAESRSLEPRALLEHLMGASRAHGAADDDQTALVVRRHGA